MPEMPRRFVRVPDEVWDRAKAKAESRNTDMSKVIRALLALWLIVDEPDVAHRIQDTL